MTHDDLGRLLKEAGDEFTMSAEIPQGLRRRVALRRILIAGTFALVLLGAGTGAVFAISSFGGSERVEPADGSPAPSPEETQDEATEWTTYYDSEHGFSIGYPGTWFRAEESLTPLLGEPFEIIAVATFDPVYREGKCAHMPSSALEDIGPKDAFVTVQEGGGKDIEAYRPRPDDFEEDAKAVEGFMCTPADVETYWLNFRDSGRAFYALVALGSDVAPQTRSDAWEVLNSFEPEAES